MTTKLYNICASTGKFKDKNGREKNRYVRVGSMFNGEYGDFIMLDAHFNPAGIPRKENSDSIFLYCFKPNDEDNSQGQNFNYSDSSPQNVDPNMWNPDDPPADIPF